MSRLGFSGAALLLAVLLLPAADLAIIHPQAGLEFGRMVQGLLAPQLGSLQQLLEATAITFAFGLLGTLVAAPCGLLLAVFWRHRSIRVLCASVRSVHELFWALLFLHVFGLTPLTGLLAIALPYSGIFAKVYAEILAEQPDTAVRQLPTGTTAASTWLCIRLPQAWPQLRSYFFARAECGLRSSAVLGFVGLPTLGYHLESALAYGAYSEASAYLLALIGLIAGFRLLIPPRSWPLWLVFLPFVLPGEWRMDTATLWQLLAHDLWPQALRAGDGPELASWFAELLRSSIWPGVLQTLLLSTLALVATGLLTLLLWPLAIRRVGGLPGQLLGHGALLLLRATPEYLLVFMFLLLWGPSMLPAVMALMLHNAGIIAFLLARTADRLPRRIDAPRGLRYYLFEVLPQLYGPYLAYLFYRWEIILRESAVVGILGIATLGFFIDSALAELRLERLLPLLIVTALLNILVDTCSRKLRRHLSLDLQMNPLERKQ